MPTQTALAKDQCTGCQGLIEDRYFLGVMDEYWHETCLRCAICGVQLVGSCFSRDHKLYCKHDYEKLYSCKCAGCQQMVSSNELVMRVSSSVYHVFCFCCVVCGQRLQKGEEFVLRDFQLFCSLDSEKEFSFIPVSPASDRSCCFYDNDEDAELDNSKGAKRPRTILTTNQRRKFKASFEINPKPSRNVREALASETGLNVRVVQVWFQNQRAKVKKIERKSYLENNNTINSSRCSSHNRNRTHNSDGSSSSANKMFTSRKKKKDEDSEDFFDHGAHHNNSDRPLCADTSSWSCYDTSNSSCPDSSLDTADRNVPVEKKFTSASQHNCHSRIVTKITSTIDPSNTLFLMQTPYFSFG